MKSEEKISVKKKDLEILASFRCEDHRMLFDKETCLDHPEQGGICNSCWAKQWALDQLGESK